ncbi:MAG: GNAT family N-acetyltransferase [Lachnospiraceae bacterium]|nr:GNAT family N-acetyltransferase [Lachnospiraceae bacterium]
MNQVEYSIRTMTMADYEGVRKLWMTIHGFGIRSIDDSKEGVERFLRRNPTTSVVAVVQDEIVGSILCGHDGRTGCFYHVCVREDLRRRGIGKAMATAAMLALQKESVSKVSLLAFKSNAVGNQFWHEEGWTIRDDVYTYDFPLNEENITRFNS